MLLSRSRAVLRSRSAFVSSVTVAMRSLTASSCSFILPESSSCCFVSSLVAFSASVLESRNAHMAVATLTTAEASNTYGFALATALNAACATVDALMAVVRAESERTEASRCAEMSMALYVPTADARTSIALPTSS